MRLGETGEAVELFGKAIRLNPSPPLWVPIWFGHCLHLNGDRTEVEVWLKEAINRNPRLAYVHARLAVLYADLGQVDKARTSVNAALSLNPDFDGADLRNTFWIDDALVPNWFGELILRSGLPPGG